MTSFAAYPAWVLAIGGSGLLALKAEVPLSELQDEHSPCGTKRRLGYRVERRLSLESFGVVGTQSDGIYPERWNRTSASCSESRLLYRGRLYGDTSRRDVPSIRPERRRPSETRTREEMS